MAVIPNVPTNLERVGPGTDNTPLFRADIDSFEQDVELKARFRVYRPGEEVNLLTEDSEDLLTENSENLQVIPFLLVGDVDSPFKLNGGTVEAEYANALPSGVYSVKALTIADSSLQSFETDPVHFFVTLPVQSPQLNLIWNVRANVAPQTFGLRWNVTVGGQADFVLKWDIIGAVTINRTLKWLKQTPWRPVEENEDIWRRVY